MKKTTILAASILFLVLTTISIVRSQVIIQGVQQLGTTSIPVSALFSNGTVAAPSIAFANNTNTGFYDSSGTLTVSAAGGAVGEWASGPAAYYVPNTGVLGFLSGAIGTGVGVNITQPIAGSVGLNGNAQVTAGADVTVADTGDISRQRYSATITPASGGAGNCGASFLAAALTADCTIATLPAGMKLAAIYADVVTFTCSGTCSGTKVMQAGTAVAGVQIFAAGLNVATTTRYGLADADLGSGMTRAAAIQGGLIGSWTTTTPISVRFTSGTGNWGSGAATFVNAGSVKFILITEQIK